MSNDNRRQRLTLDEVRSRATVTVDEFAELMGIGRTSAWAAVNAGEVPTIRIGRRVLVAVPALLRTLGDDGSLSSSAASA